MKRIVWLLWALMLVLPVQGRAAGNMQNESFAKAKRLLVLECRIELLSNILRWTRKNILESEFNQK